jgi:hypothetical protein
MVKLPPPEDNDDVVEVEVNALEFGEIALVVPVHP